MKRKLVLRGFTECVRVVSRFRLRLLPFAIVAFSHPPPSGRVFSSAYL